MAPNSSKTAHFKLINPRNGENHYLFGTRFLKFHRIRDSRWTAGDKALQYTGLANLHDRDQKLNEISEKAKTQRDSEQVQELRKTLKRQNERLKIALHGDVQRVRNLLQHDRYMQRFYPELPSSTIVERIDSKTFEKRKRLDKLMFEKSQLMGQYEAKLLDVAELQDRFKYRDSLPFSTDAPAKESQVELKNSDTRLRALRAINRAYNKVIDTMLRDSVYFDTVLKSLKDELKEQDDFITETYEVGHPAVDSVSQMNEQFEEAMEKIQREINRRTADLLEYRRKISKSGKSFLEVVRRDSDFEIDPHRYDRDTASITEFKTKMEDLSKTIKKLKIATSCHQPEEIYARMKRQTRENQRMQTTLRRRGKDSQFAKEKDAHAQFVQESLRYNLTDAEVKQQQEIDGLWEKITAEKRKQSDFEQRAKERGDHFVLIRLAFQHVIDVLRHVGKDKFPTATKKAIGTGRQSWQNLPLLNFSHALRQPKAPPARLEDDIDVLLKTVKARADFVAKRFNSDVEKTKQRQTKAREAEQKRVENELKTKEVTFQDEVEWETQRRLIEEKSSHLLAKQERDNQTAATARYYHDIVEDLYEGIIADLPVEDVQKALVDERKVEDPKIPTRQAIKAMSAKVVEMNTKEEE